jgi:hypothetical protein
VPACDVIGKDFDASRVFEDVGEATAIKHASWGAVKWLFW